MVLWCVLPTLLCLALYFMVTFFPSVIMGVEKTLIKSVLIGIIAVIIIGILSYKLFDITQKNKKLKRHSEYMNSIDILEKERERLMFKLSEYEIDNEKHKYFLEEESKINEKLDEIEKKYKVYNLILT